ncbi:MAG: aspartate kinase [Phycisphaeraceae bacterium]|nr:MAG: aspartate kinase [Phycisphaeraceae bacterium]
MGIVVQKFGGSSVADVERMRRCSRWVMRAVDAGHRVVVVVSAMGKATDRLVELAEEAWSGPGTMAFERGEGGEVRVKPGSGPPRREVDMLLSTGEQVSIAAMSIVLEAQGQPAISFTGRQIGMTTDASHTRARIESIDAGAIRKQLDAGRVVVVAGFQGVTPEGEITTLGRGGSDTTAVALAAALGAEACEIYTDVDGVYTADPRIVPNARRIDWISYEAMLEMAALGAKVMHPRAVQFGARYGVPILVLHSQQEGPGTLISERIEGMEKIEVAGVAIKADLGRVTLTGLPNKPGVAAAIFAMLADHQILVDDIIQTVVPNGEGGSAVTVSFTVEHSDLADLPPVMDKVLEAVGGGKSTIDVGFSKVSAVGVGIRSHAAVAAVMFRALADAGINIANITTSEIKVCTIVEKADGERALRAIHDAFGLGGG